MNMHRRSFIYGGLLLALAMTAGGIACRGRTTGQAELQELAASMDRRLQIAGDVAWAKLGTGAPVHDVWRENALLLRVESDAQARGLDAAAVRRFFENQLTASRLWQQHLLDSWRAGEMPPSGRAPDLVTELRPRMDEATKELLAAWEAWTRATGRNVWNHEEDLLVVAHLRAAGYGEAVATAASGRTAPVSAP
jgi:chorismate mutase